ncbi:uncharacterized protein N7483_002491 [Penicillium malachiteum]|uniref:uncharacterized protein n=1 Tax=Penicillium malachiteum TaxID=1324776 RepID=UPI002547CFAB|nr:uncharacterized protein N7483_002491 [Penicillium malachiteum]KAJ5737366.1 hypothetical protein N7483_002491 [Penicillium malachiteum]
MYCGLYHSSFIDIARYPSFEGNMQRILNSVQDQDGPTMVITPSPHETCVDDDIARPENALLTDNANPASVNDLAFGFPAIRTFQLRRCPISDEGGKPEDQNFYCPGCLLTWDYQQGRITVLQSIAKTASTLLIAFLSSGPTAKALA